ncbi:MAG: DUF1801 domain-containing protein [Anaerolineales bacterium]|nr:MAG: DUF1801 domain-containing protein [Anaerolineales bacterium]
MSQVDAFINKLPKQQRELVAAVRAMILSADPKLAERIKWSAPSFGYGSEDRITFNLRKGVMLIFHRGAKAEGDAAFVFKDPSGLVEWINNERGTVTFASLADAQASEAKFVKLVKAWLKATS